MSPSDRSSTINDVESEEKRQDSNATEQNQANEKTVRLDGKVELTEDDIEEKLGYAYPEWRKWTILVKTIPLNKLNADVQ